MNVNAFLPGVRLPSYELALWNLVIRPPRASYDTKMLGPRFLDIGDVQGIRQDVELKTPRGVMLQCSYFRPRQALLALQQVPVVIYLHGNSSCRLEVLNVLSPLLRKNFAVFCYDAAGCGQSGGEYITLGWQEKDDLACVVAHLRQLPLCGPIGIWGRSMGAVTALLYANQDPTIGAMCVDSPFASLTELMWELGNSDHLLMRAPTWLLHAAIALVRMRVSSLAGFDVEDVAPIKHVPNCFVPALFIHAQGDDFVSVANSQRLFEAYAGDKEFVQVSGGHNTSRDEGVSDRSVDFFCRALRHEPFHEVGAPPARHCSDADAGVTGVLRESESSNFDLSNASVAAAAAIRCAESCGESARRRRQSVSLGDINRLATSTLAEAATPVASSLAASITIPSTASNVAQVTADSQTRSSFGGGSLSHHAQDGRCEGCVGESNTKRMNNLPTVQREATETRHALEQVNRVASFEEALDLLRSLEDCKETKIRPSAKPALLFTTPGIQKRPLGADKGNYILTANTFVEDRRPSKRPALFTPCKSPQRSDDAHDIAAAAMEARREADNLLEPRHLVIV
eukprot:TRINITY_DN38524_c0_g1_i1.p1 TRINITY_DN38524_c0_g1~~TRINITY_DN38524_c0_g1_i1.p1  ORF type:complete len:579 (-),score=79.49 TRINITY_DN38524_c0_g1_i1:345-2054(-)